MSDESKNALINISGDLTKPATVLVEKISSAIGVAYEPTRIRRKAKAEADAAKTELSSKLELDEMQQRAFQRLINKETRKQENIESIAQQAVNKVEDNAKTEELEEDWLVHFFEQCENVSNIQMQSLWAALLAGEANKPGAISKRTINLVASLDKSDAELFTSFCQFCSVIGGLTPYILEIDNAVFNDKGINFGTINHLESLGLISFNTTSGYKRLGFGKYLTIFYFGRPINIEFPKSNDNEINVGKALLTQSGSELAVISGAKHNENFYDYLVQKLFENGLVLSTPVKYKE